MKNYKPYMRVANGLWALDKGAEMIELNLLDALVTEFRELFKSYELPSKSGLLQTVRVFPQYMPQPSAVTVKTKKDSENIVPQGYSETDIESNFPCLIVKLEGTTIHEEGTIDSSRINVNILVGIYDEAKDCQGFRDVYNILDTAREHLLTLPSRVLAQRYRLEMPLRDYLFEEQAWPIYFGQMETVWETGRPVMPYHPDCEF